MEELDIIKELEGSIERLLLVHGRKVEVEPGHSKPWDLLAKVKYQELQFNLIVKVISANSLAAFKNKINRFKASVQAPNAVPVLVAPYMSPERQALCREAGIHFMDLSGEAIPSQLHKQRFVGNRRLLASLSNHGQILDVLQ